MRRRPVLLCPILQQYTGSYRTVPLELGGSHELPHLRYEYSGGNTESSISLRCKMILTRPLEKVVWDYNSEKLRGTPQKIVSLTE